MRISAFAFAAGRSDSAASSTGDGEEARRVDAFGLAAERAALAAAEHFTLPGVHLQVGGVHRQTGIYRPEIFFALVSHRA